jgi:hypothetical protein
MAKFIEISDQNDNLFLVNVSHIVYVRKEHLKDTIILSVKDESGKSIEIRTQNNFDELKKIIKNQ